MKLFEFKKDSLGFRFSLETAPNHPDSVFMHSSAHGFSYCNSLTRQQAVDLAAALVDFATKDDAEEVNAGYTAKYNAKNNQSEAEEVTA